MIRHPFENRSQPILGDTKPKPLLQHFGRLFKDDHFQPLANPGDVGRGVIDCQRGLANDENVVARQVGFRIDLSKFHAAGAEQSRCFPLRIEQGNLRGGAH